MSDIRQYHASFLWITDNAVNYNDVLFKADRINESNFNEIRESIEKKYQVEKITLISISDLGPAEDV